MKKYIVLKELTNKNGFKATYYMTKHFSNSNGIDECEIKDAFLDYNDAFDFMLEVQKYDLPYIPRGFTFNYEIKEI